MLVASWIWSAEAYGLRFSYSFIFALQFCIRVLTTG
jgi:hypothetical protein